MRREYVYLGIGSNSGNRTRNMSTALKMLAGQVGIKLLKVSGMYETSPVWRKDPSLVAGHKNYLNCAVKITTALLPAVLLGRTQAIEKKLGNNKKHRWSPRAMDIDILFYGKRIIMNSRKLTVPHPEIASRKFVLYPLRELCPGFAHPVLGKTVRRMAREADLAGESTGTIIRKLNPSFPQVVGGNIERR